MKWLYFVLILILIVFVVVWLIIKDLETIYDKNLISNNDMLYASFNLHQGKNKLLIKKISKGVDAKSIIKIINNKQNKWSATLVTYVSENGSIRNDKDTFFITFTLDSAYIILNYKHKYFGWIQLISEKEFSKFKNEIINL